MATASTGFFGETPGYALAIPFGIFAGVLVGLINGLGVAYLRAPSMIFTLGMNAVAQGLMVFHTGGFSPQDAVTPLMREMVVGQIIPGVANPILIWAILGIVTRVRADPHNARARRSTRSATASARCSCRVWIPASVLVICFVISGACAAFGGILLAGLVQPLLPGDGRPLPPAVRSRRWCLAEPTSWVAGAPISERSRECS